MSDTVPKKPPHESSSSLAAWMAAASVTTRISTANNHSLVCTSPCASWRHFSLVPVKLQAQPGLLALTSFSLSLLWTPFPPCSPEAHDKQQAQWGEEGAEQDQEGPALALLWSNLQALRQEFSWDPASEVHLLVTKLIMTWKHESNVQNQEAAFSGPLDPWMPCALWTNHQIGF